jgi:hypothetical protein
MRSGEHKIARAYVLYRDERAQERRKREEPQRRPRTAAPQRSPEGRAPPSHSTSCPPRSRRYACAGLEGVSPEAVMTEVRRNLYDGRSATELPVPRPADPLRPLLPAHNGERIELPQAFFMRVAMGLPLRRDRPRSARHRVLQLLSTFDFMCSTPTLFNAGTLRPQLSAAS